MQFPVSDDSKNIGVTTRIIHSSGEWIESTAYAPVIHNKRMNEVQAVGSSITYLRRYSLTAAFGITGDTDDDTGGLPPQSGNNYNNKNNYNNNSNSNNENPGDKNALKEEIKTYIPKANDTQKKAIESFLSGDPTVNQMTGYISGFLKANIKL